MYSKSAVAAILLTSVAGVLGAPAPAESQQSSQTATVSPPAATPELSLTARLTLADTAADRYALLPDDKQFVFDFNQEQKGAGKGGQLVAANRKTFPALVGTGAGMAVGRVGPCGINTFHVHPRGAELQVVVKGSLVTEMTPENGVNNADGTRRVIKTTLKPFQMTPFPQGSVHVQFNDNCDETVFVAAFPSEDFGTGQVADELFAAADDDLVAAVLGQSIDGAQVDKIRKAIPKSIAQGVDSCLKKCNIPKRSL